MGSNKEGFMKEMVFCEALEQGQMGLCRGLCQQNLLPPCGLPELAALTHGEGSGRQCRAWRGFVPIWGRDPGIPLLRLLSMNLIPLPLYKLDGRI